MLYVWTRDLQPVPVPKSTQHPRSSEEAGGSSSYSVASQTPPAQLPSSVGPWQLLNSPRLGFQRAGGIAFNNRDVALLLGQAYVPVRELA